MSEAELIAAFNALNIPDMEPVTRLNRLPGQFVNLRYPLKSGQTAQLLDDSETYWGCEAHKRDSHRCYGLVSDGSFLLVCEYGDGGADPELVVYRRLSI